jgi:hypothetical protein
VAVINSEPGAIFVVPAVIESASFAGSAPNGRIYLFNS